MGKIPLLPRHKVYMNAFGYANDERFARVFVATWQAIPLSPRRRILAHWRPRLELGLSPTIECLQHWSSRDSVDVFAIGQCTLQGHELRFWAPAVDALHADLLRLLIAHELAHVHGWAAAGEASEGADRAWLKSWGFDERPLDAWIKSDKLSALIKRHAPEW